MEFIKKSGPLAVCAISAFLPFVASAANVEWTGAGANDKWKTSLAFYWNDYEPVEGMFALRAGLGFATIYSVVSQNPSSLSLVQN